jgi:hypothetical protein
MRFPSAATDATAWSVCRMSASADGRRYFDFDIPELEPVVELMFVEHWPPLLFLACWQEAMVAKWQSGEPRAPFKQNLPLADVDELEDAGGCILLCATAIGAPNTRAVRTVDRIRLERIACLLGPLNAPGPQ